MLLLLVAKGKNVYGRQAKRSRSGHSRHAYPKNVGAGTYARIRDFCPNRTDKQGRLPSQFRIVISRHSTIRERWANRRRMEGY